jgi:hypothetical protein
MGRPDLHKKRLQVKLDEDVADVLRDSIPEGARSDFINTLLRSHFVRHGHPSLKKTAPVSGKASRRR